MSLLARGSLLLAIACGLGFPSSPALAAWSASATGQGEAVAEVMPAGNPPTTLVRGNSISVSWAASNFGNGPAVEGYSVQRYSATTGAQAAVGASCSGTIAGLQCVESAVPSGDWQYTVIPIQGGWHGAQSRPSNVAHVP